MKLGRPEYFGNARSIRLRSIKRAIAQYNLSAQQIKKRFANKIDAHTSFFLKGLGNEVNLLSAFRELFFNSRELLDFLLIHLNKITAGSKSQTPHGFLRFAKNMMKGDFDGTGMRIIEFLKTNITYIYHIRKVRNEIKNNPASIEFLFKTGHFEARLKLPIENDEIELLQYLNVKNKDEALRKKSYMCTYILDEIFPEMLEFWNIAFSVLDKDMAQSNIKQDN